MQCAANFLRHSPYDHLLSLCVHLSHYVGLQGVRLPVLLPGAKQAFVPLSPSLSEEDKQVVENVVKIGEKHTFASF